MNSVIFIHQKLNIIEIKYDKIDFCNLILSCQKQTENIESYKVFMNGKEIFNLYSIEIDDSFINNLNKFVNTLKQGSLTKLYNEFFKKIVNNKCIMLMSNNYINYLSVNAKEFYMEILKLSIYYYNEEHSDFNTSLNKATNELKKLYEPLDNLLINYELYISNSGNKKIGQSLKKDRVCRYCGKSILDGVTFNNKAHIIPEAFGNKSFLCNDECDTCTHYFGEKIEPHLIRFFDIQRIFYDAHTKAGKLTLNYSNNVTVVNGNEFPVQLNASKNFNIIIQKNNNINISPDKITIDLEQKGIIFQNIYKSIVKMALNFVPENSLQYFEITKKWLLGEKTTDKLPKGYLFFKPENPKHEAVVQLFIRNSNKMELPYLVVVFSYGFISLLVIAPFSAKDTNTFLNDEDFNALKSIFPNSTFKNYQLMDFDSNNPLELLTKLNFMIN